MRPLGHDAVFNVFRYRNVACAEHVGAELQILKAAAQIAVNDFLLIRNGAGRRGDILHVRADANHLLASALLIRVEQIVQAFGFHFLAVVQKFEGDLFRGEADAEIKGACKIIGKSDADGNNPNRDCQSAPDFLLVKAELGPAQRHAADNGDKLRHENAREEVALQRALANREGACAKDTAEPANVNRYFRREIPRVNPLHLHIRFVNQLDSAQRQGSFQFKAAGPYGHVHRAKQTELGGWRDNGAYCTNVNRTRNFPQCSGHLRSCAGGVVKRNGDIDSRADHREYGVPCDSVRQIRNSGAES